MNERKHTIEVSVLIPNYNYERYLEQCIKSVIDSDFDHSKLEIVIVDDASTDKSLERINEIKSKTSLAIQVISKKVNSGLVKTRNQAILNAKGNYLFFLDADNYIGKDCIRKHYEALANSDAIACFAPIQKFDNTSNNLLGVFSNEPFDLETLHICNYIDAMSMFKKTELMEIGMYDEKMPGNGLEDYELWLRVGVNNKKVLFLSGEPLSYYRVHLDSMINSLSLAHQDRILTYIKTKFKIQELDNKVGEKINCINPIYYTSIKTFWAGEDGIFSEEKSVAHQTVLTWAPKKIILKMPELARGVAYLRFDLGEQVGVLNIHDIIIRDEQQKQIWKWDPTDIIAKENSLLIKNDEFWKGQTVQISTNNDPQFVIKTDKLTDEMIINGAFAEITLSSTDNNQYNLLTKILTKPLAFAHEQNGAAKAKAEKQQETYQLLDHIETQKLIIQQITHDKETIATEAKDSIHVLATSKEKSDRELSVLTVSLQELQIKERDLQHSLSIEIEKANELITEKNQSEKLAKEAQETIEQLKAKILELQIANARELEKNNALTQEDNKNKHELQDFKNRLTEVQLKKTELENILLNETEKKNILIQENEKYAQQLLETIKTTQEQKQSVDLLTEKNNVLLQEKEVNAGSIASLNKKIEATISQNSDLLKFQETQLKTIEQINAEKEALFNNTTELMGQLSDLKAKLSSLNNELIQEKNKNKELEEIVNGLETQVMTLNNMGTFKFFMKQISKKK